MSVISGSNLWLRCHLITTDDCQRIFDMQWRWQKPTFNAVAIINDIKQNVTLQNRRWKCFNNKENDSIELKGQLLQFVAECRCEVLHAFLLSLEREGDDSHWELVQDLEITVSKYPCKSPALDEHVLRQASGSLLLDDLVPEERPLVLCSSCCKVMDDPVLLACLHSCCRKCAKSFCRRCGRLIEDLSLESNLYVLNLMAAAVRRTRVPHGSRSNGSQPQEDEHSPKHEASCLLACTVHNDELKFWCSSCGKFYCKNHVSTKCSKTNGPCSVILFYDVAKNVMNMIRAFSSCEPYHNGTGNVANFTENCMNILREKKQRLDIATSSAIDAAQRRIEVHYGDFCAEADGIREELRQADSYTQSLCRNHVFYIFHQRKLIAQQLRMLLARTGHANRCDSLPRDADLHISGTDQRVCVNGKRLLIECLQKNYNYSRVTEELVGMVTVTETASPAHLFWDSDGIVRKEKEELSLVTTLETEVKILQANFLDAEKTVETLQQRLHEAENKLKLLEANTSVDIVSSICDGKLVKNLQTVSHVVSKSMTFGDLDEVVAVLLSHCCINDRDEQNVKKIDVAVSRAEALIDVVMKKRGHCLKYFLKSLEENALRKDLADIIRSGEVPSSYY